MDLPNIYGRISKFLFLFNKRKSGYTKGIIIIVLYVIRIKSINTINFKTGSVAAKRYNREGVMVPGYYRPEGCPVTSSSDVEVELIDNGDGLEFRTRFTNIVSTVLI